MRSQKKKTHNVGNKPVQKSPAPPIKNSLWPRQKGWMPSALLLALVAVYYWPVLSVKGFLWNDFIEQNFPYRLFAAVSLKHGVLPFWNPYVFSGMPFFADVQAAVLYPLNLVLTFFASDDWLDPVVVEYQVIFHILLAGIFMFLLARRWECNRTGSMLAAITFMFCGFFTTHIFHVNLVQTAAWFPLIVLLFDSAMKKTSMLYAAGTAIALCAAFLSGYPQLMLHMYYWMAAYFLFLLITNIKKGTTVKKEIGRGALFGVIVALGLGMSAVQFFPTQEMANNSVRPKLEFQESCEGSLRPYRLVTLLAPDYFGKPNQSTYWGIAENDFNSGAHYYWETAIYTGIAPLILAVLTLVFARTPLMIFLGIMGSLSLFLAMGNSFFMYGIFYNLLPGFKSFRVPGPLCLYVHRVNCAAGRLRHAVAARRFNGRRPRKTETACLPHYRRCRVSLRPVGTSGGRGCFKGRYHGFPHEFPAFRRSGIGPAKAYRRAPVSSGAQGNLDMRFIFYCRKRHCSAPVPQETIRQTNRNHHPGSGHG